MKIEFRIQNPEFRRKSGARKNPEFRIQDSGFRRT
jgi:hypothetical protein